MELVVGGLRLMRLVYTLLIRCLVPFAFALVLWRGMRDRGYWQGLGERFGRGIAVSAAPSLWVHAVSLGEMSAAAPLIRAMHARQPRMPLVITTSTPAGRARAQELFGADADISFLPYDTPGAMRRFVARVRPRMTIIMETELWPNLFRACASSGVPVVLANARLSARSVQRYRRCGTLFAQVFAGQVLIAAQSAEDAARFVAIGADRGCTQVAGNIKFDVEVDAHLIEKGRRMRGALSGERPTWLAGSTHPGEDEQVLAAHQLLRAQRPDALLLLAPRHRDRFETVARLLGERGIPFERRSSDAARGDAVPLPLAERTQVLLVDTLGELAMLYTTADIAFVGGSLVPIGGHNLLEPAALGIPVLTGPHTFNSPEVARQLVAQGAALIVADAAQIAQCVRRLFDDRAARAAMGQAGRRMIAANRGSVARLLEIISRALGQSGSATARPAVHR